MTKMFSQIVFNEDLKSCKQITPVYVKTDRKQEVIKN